MFITRASKKTEFDNYILIDDDTILINLFNPTDNRAYRHGLSKTMVVSHTKDMIILNRHDVKGDYCAFEAITLKKDLVREDTLSIVTYKYNSKKEWWETVNTVKKETQVITKTPLDIFKEDYNGSFGLIETEEEFNQYLTSSLEWETWCRVKLFNKMKELGLGEGFITHFADLIDCDLKKYHAMIDLANEVKDKDVLMYLYTYKFG